MSHNTVINQAVIKSILIISLNSIQDWSSLVTHLLFSDVELGSSELHS